MECIHIKISLFQNITYISSVSSYFITICYGLKSQGDMALKRLINKKSILSNQQFCIWG